MSAPSAVGRRSHCDATLMRSSHCDLGAARGGPSTKGDIMKFSVPGPRTLAFTALVAATAPFVGLTSADASTTTWGCTVHPERPVFDHINPANGDKVIRYDMTVTCSAGRTIYLNQHIHEEDSPTRSKHQVENDYERHFASSETVTMGWLLTLRQDDPSGAEEQFHMVSFQVETDNQATSDWTAYDKSVVQQFSN
jgi:hypothetical protein